MMGCDEPLSRGGGTVERVGRSGLVQTGQAGGHFGMRRFAVGGLAGGDVVTGLSQVARNVLGRREIRCDDLCTSAGWEGRAGTGKHGFSLTGGQVVAGSNPVSPTFAGQRLFSSVTQAG